MSDHHFWLSARSSRLRPLLPEQAARHARVDDRRVISGIIHVIRNGLMWRDAPAVYGPPKTLYNRFIRWAGDRRVQWDLCGPGRRRLLPSTR